MKITLNLPDDLYERYAKVSGGDDQVRIAETLFKRLLYAEKLDPAETYLHLTGADRLALEALFAATIPDARTLIEKVSLLSHISIGGIRLEFTPAQLAEIKRKAVRNGDTPEAYAKRIVKMMEGYFFAG